jgi:hypothetical protein
LIFRKKIENGIHFSSKNVSNQIQNVLHGGTTQESWSLHSLQVQGRSLQVALFLDVIEGYKAMDS